MVEPTFAELMSVKLGRARSNHAALPLIASLQPSVLNENADKILRTIGIKLSRVQL